MFFPTLTPQVYWSNACVGFWTGRSAAYNAYSWTSAYAGGFRTYPNDSSRMFVIFYDHADEVDGIDLHS